MSSSSCSKFLLTLKSLVFLSLTEKAEILKKEKFEVTTSDTLDVFLTDLTKYDLIVPIWTMGALTSEQENNVCAAIAAGTGIAGCHGGMCDAFRNNTLWQFMTGAQWVAHPGNADVTYEG